MFSFFAQILRKKELHHGSFEKHIFLMATYDNAI